MSGWVKLHRNILEWEWYDDPNTMRVFIHCLIKANYKDKNWRGIEIKRGQFISSLDSLSNELKLSVQQIRTSLKKLKSTNEITSKGGNQHTVFTVVSYDLYNQSTDEATNEQQTDNKRVTATKNDKKEKNDKEINLSAIAKPMTKKKFNDDDIRFAEWFYSGLISINPNHKKPNFESSGWADAVRLMREQDNRTYDEMASLFKWVTQDSFWKSNILSPKKLREKWDALKIKSMEANQPNRSREGREINSGNIATLVDNVKSGNKRF